MPSISVPLAGAGAALATPTGAMLGAAGLSGAAGIGSAIIGSGAAKDAAKTQADAATQAAQQQMAMFQMGQTNFDPYLTAGKTATGSLQLLTNTGQDSTNPLMSREAQFLRSNMAPHFMDIFKDGQSWLEKTPGYQFTLDQGLKSTQSALSAQGLGGFDPKLNAAPGGASGGGSLIKGLSQYATGLASNTFQQQFQNYLATNQQRFGQAKDTLGTVTNTLSGLAGLGQNSAAGVGSLGVQSQTAANQLLTSGAAATAGGTVGSANAITGGLGTIAGAGQQYALLNALTSGGMFGKPAVKGAWGTDNGQLPGQSGQDINPFPTA